MVKLNKEKGLKNDFEGQNAQIISFYGYKGGTGKTTALIKTALLLAEKGKKVAIIDMDLEEPGFYNAFSSDLKLEGGLVNYLYNKYNGTVKSSVLEISSFVKKLSLRASGAVYVVPAGRLNSEYIKMVKFLKEKRIVGNRDILDIINSIKKLYNIDYVLIDSRQGINFWGGLSLNDLVDEVVMFAYPDIENIQGINIFLETIQNKAMCTLVLSKVGTTESAHLELENLLKKIDMKKNFIKISYDEEMAEKAKYPLEGKVKRYAALRDSILENEVKRKNKKWIEDHVRDVEELIDNFAEGKNFNKILTEDELKIVSEDKYVIAIDESVKLKNIVEGYYEKKKVIDLKFYNKTIKKVVEKHCSSSEFLDISCLAMFSLALISLDESVKVNNSIEIEKILGKNFMDFYYKSNSSKGRILNSANYFCELLKAKENEETKIICVNIDKLMELISLLEVSCGVNRAKNNVLFRMLFLIFNVLNRNPNYQFKLVLNDKKYKKDEDFCKEFKGRILDLSWNDIYKKEDVIGKVDTITNKIFKDEIYTKVKKEVVFPLSVEENGVKIKFNEWFVNNLKRQRLLSKKGVIDVLKESALLEKKNDKEKSSVITISKIQTAIQRCAFR